MNAKEYFLKKNLKKKADNPEHRLQVYLMKLVKIHLKQYPELELLHAIPNGGKRHLFVAVKLKAEGVKAGIPDLHLPVARCGYHSLYLEAKSGDNGLTENQKEVIPKLEEQGNAVIVFKDANTALDVLITYISGNTERFEYIKTLYKNVSKSRNGTQPDTLPVSRRKAV